MPFQPPARVPVASMPDTDAVSGGWWVIGPKRFDDAASQILVLQTVDACLPSPNLSNKASLAQHMGPDGLFDISWRRHIDRKSI